MLESSRRVNRLAVGRVEIGVSPCGLASVHEKAGVRWLVATNTDQPIPGETKMVRVNLYSGK